MAKQFITELDGFTYKYSKHELEQIPDIVGLRGDIHYITDFQEQITRVSSVEAPKKYAEMVVRRQLQDSGEFNEPVSVIGHWKKSLGPNTTSVLYTALPTRIMSQYREIVANHDDCVLLFPVYRVMLGLLNMVNAKKPAAVVFRHDRHAELLIGSKDRMYYANRCVAFDTSEAQISFLWETVRNEIASSELEHRIQVNRVYYLNWVDSDEEPEWPESQKAPLSMFEQRTIMFDGRPVETSLLKAVDGLPAGTSASGNRENWYYRTRRLAPYLTLIVFLAALALGAGYHFLNTLASGLESDLVGIQKKIRTLENMPELKPPADDYRQTLNLLSDLTYCRRAPSFKQVVNEISGSIPLEMKMDVLKVQYSPASMDVELFGNVSASFEDAYQGYQAFMKRMTERGYKVTGSRLTTEVTATQFLVKLSKEIK